MLQERQRDKKFAISFWFEGNKIRTVVFKSGQMQIRHKKEEDIRPVSFISSLTQVEQSVQMSQGIFIL